MLCKSSTKGEKGYLPAQTGGRITDEAALSPLQRFAVELGYRAWLQLYQKPIGSCAVSATIAMHADILGF
eukprot:1158553-Pelagomonas_calceolata.AAC.9